MRIRLITLCMVLIGFAGMANAQEEDPFTTGISDELTVNAEQNQEWRMGQSKYPAKPRHMWELGVNFGHAFVAGDVEAPFFSGFGVGLSVRRAISYVLSLRLSGQYTSSKGGDARATSYDVFSQELTFLQNGGANGPLGQYEGRTIHRNYKASTFGGSLELLVNVGNILFHKPDNNWNMYLGAGLGLHSPDTKVNLFDGDESTTYNFESVTAGLDITSNSDRKDARKNLRDLLDSDYETPGGVENTIAKFGDEKNVLYHFLFSVGVSRKISDRFNIGLEHQLMWSDNDLLDGFEYRSTADKSRNNDVGHYTSIRLGINLGSFEKRVEPLYWVNPLDAPYSDIAELKQRPKFDLTDSDGDGVIDMIDQEKNSPAGSPVDTRGVTLDSDGDGVADYKDKERYSPPGYTVDRDGVAQTPHYLTEEEVVDIMNNRPQSKGEWFLPMIHFDLDKYYVKPEFYGQLHSVAQVMKMHPNLKVVAEGYADNRDTEDYNNVLSYKRAEAAIDYLTSNYSIPRDRFLLMYAGEQEAIVSDLPSNHSTSRQEELKHYMNRRVEFRVALEGDTNMTRPDGPDAGSATPGSSRSGSKYSGNTNSGY